MHDHRLDARADGLPTRARRLLRDARRAMESRDVTAAEALLTRAEPFATAHPEYQRLLGVMHHLNKRYADARLALIEADRLRPSDPVILTNLGTTLRECGDASGSLAVLRRACDLDPGLAAAWNNLAQTLNAEAFTQEASDAYARALACDPGHLKARLGYAKTLSSLGRTADAAREVRHVLRESPDDMRAWSTLANLKTIRLTAEEAAWLERNFETARFDDNVKVRLGFALAKALEDQGRDAEAFAIYTAVNRIERQAHEWDADAFSARIDATMAAFPIAEPALTNSTQGKEVIFIISLPRSGSTLTEQILASHPSVEGANELADLQIVIDEESQRRNADFPEWAAVATPDDWQRLGADYLERTSRWQHSRERFTDKSLGTWRHVGAAIAMLPQARFVYVHRDPVETCLSCFRQLFGRGHGYSYDLNDMAAYWSDCDRLMTFWNTRYPGRIHSLKYESLVAQPEDEVRKLLAFCGLEYDAGCLRYYDTPRNVRTVSAAQVREPLRSDTARAARFGALLDGLRRDLGVADAD